jgi:uncharacterized protein (TIGR02678 family)
MSRLRTPDRQRAFLDLLDHVAVTSWREPAAFRRIRAHQDDLRSWFADRAGWPLVQRRDVFRLLKSPALPSPGHALQFARSALDYELLVWLLWYAETNGDETFILTHLTEEIEARASDVVGRKHVDWDQHQHRLALRRVLVGLEELGVLERLDGDTEEWAASRSGNSVYEFTVLARQLYLDFPSEILGEPSERPQIPDLAPLLRPTPARTASLRGVTPQQRLYRSLLLDPALFRPDDPEAFSFLMSAESRRRIAEDLAATLGWDLEITPHYAALLRPAASEASEQGLFPQRSALCDAALMLLTEVRALVEAGELQVGKDGSAVLTEGRYTALVNDLRRRYAEFWGSVLKTRGVKGLAEDLREFLASWDLLREDQGEGLLHVMPTAARLRAVYSSDIEAQESDLDDAAGGQQT